MTGIWEYPDLNELEQFLLDTYSTSKENIQSTTSPAARLMPSVDLSKILIFNNWGDGTAELGEDELEVIYFISFRGPDEVFDTIEDALTEEMVEVTRDEFVERPENIQRAFAGMEFRVINAEIINNILTQMANSDLELVFDLTAKVAIDLKQGTSPDEYPRISVEELRESSEEELDELRDDVADDEPEEEMEQVEDEPSAVPESIFDIPDAEPPIPLSELREITSTEDEDEGPEFPNINPRVRSFAVDEDTLEIPAGKEEKQIPVREPFDFEIEMAEPGLQTTGQTAQRTREEIATVIGRGQLGETEPVGTYPRTGIYVRNYLKFRGPAYSYEIYKNLVYYSAYISGLHNINVRAGSYNSFREYIYVLQEVDERGGPKLIEPLSQPQAAAQGLETVPDHPSIEDKKAPWLENRQYYDLIEENEDSDIWNNPYDYLHENESD